MNLDTADIDSKPKRGRPRIQPLSKNEYDLQAYYKNKEHISKTNARNTQKYRESFKLLKKMIDDPTFLFLSDILKQEIKGLINYSKNIRENIS
jgi:hypothetical protein